MAVEAVLSVQILAHGSLVAVAADLIVGDTVEVDGVWAIVSCHSEFDCFNNYNNQTLTTNHYL